jgi:hypothetical protein
MKDLRGGFRLFLKKALELMPTIGTSDGVVKGKLRNDIHRGDEADDWGWLPKPATSELPKSGCSLSESRS